jgi:predicted GNAT family acetyltransferase
MSAQPEVRHNEPAHRYEIEIDGNLAVADYEMQDGKQVFTRTLVPEALRGRGLAEALVRRALNDARIAGRKVVPACSYVARFIERNKEFSALLG